MAQKQKIVNANVVMDGQVQIAVVSCDGHNFTDYLHHHSRPCLPFIDFRASKQMLLKPEVLAGPIFVQFSNDAQ